MLSGMHAMDRAARVVCDGLGQDTSVECKVCGHGPRAAEVDVRVSRDNRFFLFS